MFKLSSVSFAYGKTDVLKDFSLIVENGQCVVLKGASGCGKTTAAMLLCGIYKPQKGEVTAPKNIAVVFQEDRFIENLSLKKNIRLSIGKENYDLADSLLKRVGLYNDKDKKISELSGGMKRRAAIVRAVAFGGDGIILDEAFNGIDKENKLICADIIKEYYINKNKPVLIITHIDEDAALFNADTVSL